MSEIRCPNCKAPMFLRHKVDFNEMVAKIELDEIKTANAIRQWKIEKGLRD